MHHLQVAKVLLEAGMGEAARSEARLAVKLDPNSALAERTLADILKHDLVGRNMRAGSDMGGAADAYRAAIKLDPDDHTAQGESGHSAGVRLRRAALRRPVEHEGGHRRVSRSWARTSWRIWAFRTIWPSLCFMAAICRSAIKAAQALNPAAQGADCGQRGHDAGQQSRPGRGQQALHRRRLPTKRPRAPPARC